MTRDTEFFFKWSECQLRVKELVNDGWQCSVVKNIDNMFVIRKDIQIDKRCIEER